MYILSLISLDWKIISGFLKNWVAHEFIFKHLKRKKSVPIPLATMKKTTTSLKMDRIKNIIMIHHYFHPFNFNKNPKCFGPKLHVNFPPFGPPVKLR